MIFGKNLRGNQEWAIQKHRHNWTQNTTQRQTKQNTKDEQQGHHHRYIVFSEKCKDNFIFLERTLKMLWFNLSINCPI